MLLVSPDGDNAIFMSDAGGGNPGVVDCDLTFDDEAPTLARLHDEWMPQHGLTFNGDHHEIYLSDARRTAPEKLRTILRQPVRPV